MSVATDEGPDQPREAIAAKTDSSAVAPSRSWLGGAVSSPGVRHSVGAALSLTALVISAGAAFSLEARVKRLNDERGPLWKELGRAASELPALDPSVITINSLEPGAWFCLLSVLILLWAKVAGCRARASHVGPEAISVIALFQNLHSKPVPTFFDPLVEQINHALTILSTMGPTLTFGRCGWVGAALFTASAALRRERLPTWPWWLLLGFAPLLTNVGALLCFASLFLLLAPPRGGAWLWWPSTAASLNDLSARAALTIASASCFLASDISAPKSRIIASGVWAAVSMVGALELAALLRRRATSVVADRTALAMLDGHARISPFIIPNEARYRAFSAIVYATTALFYQAQTLAALVCEQREATFVLLTLGIVLLTFSLAPLLGQPGGDRFADYDPRNGWTRTKNAALEQDDDEALFEELLVVTEHSPPAFSVFLTRGYQSPSARWGLGGAFIEVPRGTLARFLEAKDTDSVRALLAHEVAHIEHGDPALLAIATTTCTSAVVLGLATLPFLFLSPMLHSALPSATPVISLLMTGIAIVAHTVLLRSAQRKIELLADMRAAFRLQVLAPLRRMVLRLLALEHKHPSWLGDRAAWLSLGATSTAPSHGTFLGRLRRLIDTHESLDERFARLQRGIHALNPPDALTLFTVSALAWVPSVLADDIIASSWCPSMLRLALGALSVVSTFLEYYFLAVLVVSPRGATADEVGVWKLHAAYLGGAGVGLLVTLLVALFRWPELPKFTYTMLEAMLWSMASDAPEQAAAASGLAVLGAAGAFALIVLALVLVYLVMRATFITLLQQTGRTLLLRAPSMRAASAILSPFLVAAALKICFFPLFDLIVPLDSTMPRLVRVIQWLSTNRTRPDLPQLVLDWILLSTAAVLLLSAGLSKLMLVGSRRCCGDAKVTHTWIVNTLYRGCPACGAPLATSLLRWHPAPPSAGTPYFRRWVLAMVPVLVLAGFVLQVAPTPTSILTPGAPYWYVREHTLDPDKQAVLRDEIALERLNVMSTKSLTTLVKALWLEQAPATAAPAAARLGTRQQFQEWAKPSTRAAQLTGLLDTKLPVWAHGLAAAYSWPQILGAVAPTMNGVVMTAPPGSTPLSLTPCKDLPPPGDKSGLLDVAVCKLLHFEFADARAAFQRYEPNPTRGVVGVGRALAAALAGDAATAIDDAGRYLEHCEVEPGSCPAETRTILREIATLATTYHVTSGAVFACSSVEERLAWYPVFEAHLLALRGHLAARALDTSAGLLLQDAALSRLADAQLTPSGILESLDAVLQGGAPVVSELELQGSAPVVSEFEQLDAFFDPIWQLSRIRAYTPVAP